MIAITARRTGPEVVPARIPYGSLISWVLTAAFTLSATHTIYSELAGIADPGFRAASPVVWAFYALGFGAAASARRAGRTLQLALIAFLGILLGISVLYYPTTFTPERQTVFGWIENDVYIGLLMLAATLSVLRLFGTELGTQEAVALRAPSGPGAAHDGPIDVHDMVVVHRAFRRELRVVPELVRTVPSGDLVRAGVVSSHLRLCLDGVHLHHTSEDDLLWPLLAERANAARTLVRTMADQHTEVEQRLGQIERVLDRWQAEARPAVGAELAASIDALRESLLAHLDDEERLVLPLAAIHLSQDEWAAIGQAGVAKMTRRQLPLMFGMVMEDATPQERREMLGVLPVPVRLLLRTWGARRYDRYVRDVRQG